MSTEHEKKGSGHEGGAGSGKDAYRLPVGGTWDNAWKAAAAIGVVGLLLCTLGWSTDARRFAFSWLFAFITFLTLGLGAIFFVVVQHLTGSFWSVTVRRTAELFAAAIPVFALLFVPIAMELGDLYEWAEHGEEASEPEGGAGEGAAEEEHSEGESLLGASVARAQDNPNEPEAGEHGEAPQAGEHAEHHTPQHVVHARLLEHKSHWLSAPYFYARALFYFLVWIVIALFYYRSSTRQDETKALRLTARMQWWAPLSMLAFAVTFTFAVFDWVMSLEPTWYSTIYGVYLWAGSAVAIHALVTVVTLGLRAKGHLGDAVNTEHFHDLGKMTFGFIVFWAYVGFSQMMLIWYANIPEETIYYNYRWHGEGWRGVSWFLVFGHFALPFIFLISRNIKRRLQLLAFGSMWMLVMHAVDVYWFVMPNVERGRLAPHWLDLAALMAVGGVYFAIVLFNMRRHPLIPTGDPRLERCLHHVNA